LDPFALSRLTALAATLVAAPALASDQAPASAYTLSWHLDAWVVALLAASALTYALGVRRLWRRAGPGRGITYAQAGRFAAGWLVLGMALVSPIDTLGTKLFSAHMLQHELLMVVAAPLLVLSRPLEAWTWALKPSWRRRLGSIARIGVLRRTWRWCTEPTGAWTLQAVALWVWHVPPLFDAAVRNEAVHIAQHTCFLASALFFWWSVLSGGAGQRSAAAMASLFTTMLHTSALGALLALAGRPWYAHYAQVPAFGLSPLEDQQLGGLVMWVPGGIGYLLAALYIVAGWLSAAPRNAPR
jgi:putative membrane protein